eukprot:5157958-Pyramimonas_sp.AAC.1
MAGAPPVHQGVLGLAASLTQLRGGEAVGRAPDHGEVAACPQGLDGPQLSSGPRPPGNSPRGPRPEHLAAALGQVGGQPPALPALDAIHERVLDAPGGHPQQRDDLPLVGPQGPGGCHAPADARERKP